MKIRIYANYGVLAHEKQTVYATYRIGSCNEPVDVELPDDLDIGYNAADEMLITVDGINYMLDELLDAMPDTERPCLRWYDGHQNHRKELKVIKWYT